MVRGRHRLVRSRHPRRRRPRWGRNRATHHETGCHFGFDGTTEPLFDEDARSITTSVNVTAALGVVCGVDVWGQVLAHRLVFRNAVGTRRSTGLSDLLLEVEQSLHPQPLW
ncbi:hypothetical protein CRI93_05940 [Longimonas halophila]|uniref:Uncharacterized protein n=1 Tax=Longimonas halophila TaxID=1469170 RepID=A0A2H3NQN2_9BACT|nr:hypothetical protein [Longimonas halophila]PEN07983.1 hypothetical protein CRI93_05940 [Longimonas halophila]